MSGTLQPVFPEEAQKPELQAKTQAPEEHDGVLLVVLQAAPQVPQLVALVSGSVHVPLQHWVSPTFGSQAFPQALQLATSDVVSTQRPPQQLCPLGQDEDEASTSMVHVIAHDPEELHCVPGASAQSASVLHLMH